MIIKAFLNNKEINLELLGAYGYSGNVRVIYECDICGCHSETTYSALKKKNRLDKQYCRKCTIKNNNSVEKRKSTCRDRYRVSNPMQMEEFKNKFSKSNIATYSNQKVDFNLIKKSFEDCNYKLLTTEYKNNKQKLRYICNNKHEGSISWNSWIKGRRCKKCSNDRARTSIEYVIEELEKEGYKLLSKDFINVMTPIKYMCPVGHIGYVRFHHWTQHGHRCSSCSKIKSNAELKIYEFIRKYFTDAISGNKTLIKPYELDIVIPHKKVAIEYCGLYWHSEKAGKDKKYHLSKLNRCKDIGYKLITVFEDEWINNRKLVESRIKSILGLINKRINARDCHIREIGTKTKNEFLNKYHLQGKDNSSYKLGAFYNSDLIAVMTFSKGSIAKGNSSKENIYELSRFCSVPNYTVNGIASKMFKYFIRNYNPKEVFSYADRRWSDGNLYYKIGFNKVSYSEPNYWYIDGFNRIHRFNYRKSLLSKKLKYFNPKLTEVENMYNNRFNRIWDCGNIKFVWSCK